MSKRAKPLDPEEEDYYYEDEVDERNNPTNEAPVVPPGFLSPSVREYLDLGKSIPGTYIHTHYLSPLSSRFPLVFFCKRARLAKDIGAEGR